MDFINLNTEYDNLQKFSKHGTNTVILLIYSYYLKRQELLQSTWRGEQKHKYFTSHSHSQLHTSTKEKNTKRYWQAQQRYAG